MFVESSITLLENIYSTGVTHDNCNKFIAKTTSGSMGPDMFGNFYFTKSENGQPLEAGEKIMHVWST